MLCNKSTHIMAKVHPLSPTEVIVERTTITEDTIKEKINDVYYTTCRLCELHRFMIITFVMCLCVGSIVISVIIKSNNITVSPCYHYKSDTLASDVSVECVKYLWNNYQCSTALESSPTWRWWIQSPQGTTLVRCDATHTGTACGVGSYQAISVYIALCNPRYGQ